MREPNSQAFVQLHSLTFAEVYELVNYVQQPQKQKPQSSGAFVFGL
jgi:hypothetical protein